MNEEIKLEREALIFKALGHKSRLLIVKALANGPLCVCKIQEIVSKDISTVSKHLGVLKDAGIVTSEKRGTSIYYSLSICCLSSFIECCDNIIKNNCEKYH